MSIVHLPPSPPGYLARVVDLMWTAHGVRGRLAIMSHVGRAGGRAFAKWWLQHVSPGCCHVLPSHHYEFGAGMCELVGEDICSPVSGTSLPVPADEVWLCPKLSAGGQRPEEFSSSEFLLLQEEETSPWVNCGLVASLRLCKMSPWWEHTSKLATAIKAKCSPEDGGDWCVSKWLEK